MSRQAWAVLVIAAIFWCGLPLRPVFGPGADNAAWAKGSNSGSGSGGSGSGNSGSGSGNSGSGSGSSGSGSGNSGSGSSGGSNDDDDDDDNSGPGNGGSGGVGGGATGLFGPAAKGQVGRLGRGGPLRGVGGIHVQFADGRIERIRANVFEALDSRGKLVERHAASGQEQSRLREMEASIARRGRQSGLLVVAEIDESAGSAEITDFRGWREIISGGRYVLSDPEGRTVARRALLAADVARLRTMLFLD